MTLLALAETRTFWSVALAIGAVVIAVMVILMSLLLSYLRDTAASVTGLLEVAEEIETNTAALVHLEQTAPVLEMIRAEALTHDEMLEAQLR